MAVAAKATGGITIEAALDAAGTGAFQRRLLAIFGLVWAADAMQVLAIGFTAPSIAKSFGMTVPQALQAGTVFFVGMLIGAAAFGRLADRIGRRNLLIVTVLIDAVFGLASAFAPNFIVLAGFRFMTGLAVGGTLPVDYAMMAEFLPTQRRGRWLVALEGFWALGTLVVALAAWYAASAGFEEPWRFIFIITALPALVGVGLRLLIPESPFYLARSGREAEAKAVLDRMALANGGRVLPGRLTVAPVIKPPFSALFAPPIGRRSVLVLAAWLLVSVAYYGVFTWLPGKLVSEGHGFVRGYGFLVLLAIAQLPGYALAAWGVERFGRKPTLIAFLLLSAAGCFLYAVLTDPGPIAGAMLLMSFALLGTWGALYAFTPELYPTTLRASGMGIAGAMARLGGLLAPTLVGIVVGYSFNVALAMFAALLLIGAVCTALIDVETKGAPLA
ncbi:MFS transporter, putative metabolite:H+ symporter [Kaistia soli DSM 19436]|uniref:MFS transporter, putative metabolite:H+ symporter n=1 Tax=Kaistia soli DSM 19436 TaxID=1122133 RepID=A0A1M5N6K3_9HYPH|nr:MFS transporter [Kaistia soli]SHG85087.1 MFS transporter, putative metabolite:H+ symporter [Kaistia soli DSM 19436]